LKENSKANFADTTRFLEFVDEDETMMRRDEIEND
jgi:hypothetical protein